MGNSILNKLNYAQEGSSPSCATGDCCERATSDLTQRTLPARSIKPLKTKKGRDESGLFIVEGEKFVQEIPQGWHVRQYIMAERFACKNELAIYEERAICVVVRDSVFDSLADTVSPQGILAVCEMKKLTLEKIQLVTHSHQLKSQFFLIGENLNDPGNIGALIRTAAAAGASGVILTAGSGDIYNPKVLRAAAGAALRIPTVTDVYLQDIADVLKLPIYAAHPRGDKLPYHLDMTGSFCLLVGSESHGITDTAANLASELVTLPMVSSTESLNASVAGSILLYEAVRQRQ